MYKYYYHRYGKVSFRGYKTLEDAIESAEHDREYGEAFADCITDMNDKIVHDFSVETFLIGSGQNESRVGEFFATVEKTDDK